MQQRGPVGFSAVHLQSYGWRPARARRDVCDDEHAGRKEGGERGRALLGPVVSWTSLLEKSTESDTWSHPKYGPSGRFAGFDSHTWLRACADGGALGPKGGHRPKFEITFKLQGAEEGIGHFRCTNLASVQNHAPDSPSKRHHRGSSQHTPAEDTRSKFSRGKRVPQSHGGSECNHPAECAGPRRYIRWREYIRWRCLYNVDDGACNVCITNSVENSRLKSLRAGQAGRFLGGGLGELLSADFTRKFDSNTGQHSCISGVFLTCFSQSKNALPGRPLSTLNLSYPRVGIVIRRVSVWEFSVLLIVEGVVFFVSTLGPPNRVTWPFIATPSVETREPEDVWTSVACPVNIAVSVSVGPIQSSLVYFLSLQCLAAACLALFFVLACVFCMCFALAFAFVFPLSVAWVRQICWQTRWGILFLFLFFLVHVCLRLVFGRVVVFVGRSFAYGRCWLS